MSAKRIGFILLVLLTLTILVGGCFKKSDRDQAQTAGAIGVIDVNQAAREHPKFQQLAVLKQELDTLLARVETGRQAALRPPMPAGMAVPDGAAMNEALQQQFQEKMTARQKELQEVFTVKAAEIQDRLASELQAYQQQVDNEYQPQIFNLQLKLKTVRVDQDEMTALQQQLQELQTERTDKLAVKEKELAEQLNALMLPEQTALGEQLNAYAAELQAELSQQAQAKSAEFSARNAALMAAGSDDLLKQAGELERQAGMKRQEVKVLEEFIMQEVRDQAGKIAADRGLDSVIADVTVNVKAVDITQAVITEFKK